MTAAMHSQKIRIKDIDQFRTGFIRNGGIKFESHRSKNALVVN